MIAIWMVSAWQVFGKPKNFNIIELGPGDGSLTKVMLNVFKRFPEFNSAKKIYLYEICGFLKNLQKKNIKDSNIKWIRNFRNIKNGPVVFFGNEFFDAIPIKQFKRNKNQLFEKFYTRVSNMQITETFKKASKQDSANINSFKSLKNLKFIEFPKIGFIELKKIINKIIKLKGCFLMIDYGYLKSKNENTLQSVMRHKKNNLLNNLGDADITSLVNFKLFNEFCLRNKQK